MELRCWKIGVLLMLVLIIIMLVNCSKERGTESLPEPVPLPEPEPKSLRERYSTTPDRWPEANWYDGILKNELAALPDAPYVGSQSMLSLGKVLFFDTRLGNRGNSCASCHVPGNYWTDKTPTAAGGGNRNTPNMENVWYLDGHLMLDGRARTFAQQISIAIESPHEMNGKVSELPTRLKRVSGYKPLFNAAYGDEQITVDRILGAIEAYSKSIHSTPTLFDRFIQGEYTAFNEQQLEGLHLFRTKAACINCHNGPFFTDLQYHNLGNSLDFDRKPDNGRGDFTGRYADNGKFRTPGLRNVAYTVPYMHNGSVNSLDNMIDLLIAGMPQMNGQRVHGELSPYIRKLELTYEERNALIAFINTLSGERPQVERPALPD